MFFIPGVDHSSLATKLAFIRTFPFKSPIGFGAGDQEQEEDGGIPPKLLELQHLILEVFSKIVLGSEQNTSLEQVVNNHPPPITLEDSSHKKAPPGENLLRQMEIPPPNFSQTTSPLSLHVPCSALS